MNYTEILLRDFFVLDEYKGLYSDEVKENYLLTNKIESANSRKRILDTLATRYYSPINFKGRGKTRKITHNGLKPESEWTKKVDGRANNKGGNNHLPYREKAEAVLSNWVRTIKPTNEKGRRQLWTPFSIVMNLGLFIDSSQMSKWATMSGNEWIYKKDYVSNKDTLEKAIDELLIEYQQYFNALTPFEYAGEEYNGYLWKWQKERLIRLYRKFFQDKANDIVDKWVLKTPINHEIYYLASVENIEKSDEEREKLTFYNCVLVYIDEATFADYKSWQANLKNLKTKDDEIEKRCRKKFGFNFAYKAYCFSNNDDQPPCGDTQSVIKEIRNLLYERLINLAKKANTSQVSYKELSMDDDLSLKALIKMIKKEDVTFKLKRHREFLKLSKVIYTELINPSDAETYNFYELETVSEGTPDGFVNERIKEAEKARKLAEEASFEELLETISANSDDTWWKEKKDSESPTKEITPVVREPFVYDYDEDFEDEFVEEVFTRFTSEEELMAVHAESAELERNFVHEIMLKNGSYFHEEKLSELQKENEEREKEYAEKYIACAEKIACYEPEEFSTELKNDGLASYRQCKKKKKPMPSRFFGAW